MLYGLHSPVTCPSRRLSMIARSLHEVSIGSTTIVLVRHSVGIALLNDTLQDRCLRTAATPNRIAAFACRESTLREIDSRIHLPARSHTRTAGPDHCPIMQHLSALAELQCCRS